MKWWSRLVWNLSISPKAKIFWWRALNNLIPTEANLRSHHVPIEGTCGSCYSGWDTTVHSLIFCPEIKKTWKNSKYWTALYNAQHLDLMSIAWVIREKFEKEEYKLWVVMVWQVWVEKCRAQHDEKGEKQKVTETNCVAQWEAFQNAKPEFAINTIMGMKLGEKVWRPPKRGTFRVDVDALYDEQTGVFGMGAIVRDEEGNICAAMTKRMQPTSNPMVAEVMAVIQGIILCIKEELAPIIVYTDSMLAARTMAGPDENKAFLPQDLQDILKVAREDWLMGVLHMYRTANLAAHSLAQFAREIDDCEVWTSDYPPWLRDIVSKDLE